MNNMDILDMANNLAKENEKLRKQLEIAKTYIKHHTKLDAEETLKEIEELEDVAEN